MFEKTSDTLLSSTHFKNLQSLNLDIFI